MFWSSRSTLTNHRHRKRKLGQERGPEKGKFISDRFFYRLKGQLLSKANCQAKDSSKKRPNEFVFTSMRRVFVLFLRILGQKKTFREYLAFNFLRFFTRFCFLLFFFGKKSCIANFFVKSQCSLLDFFFI